MNNCTNSEIQDLLPELEHGKLTAAVRQSVEAHLAGCEGCREDLDIIHTVKSAAVFAPSIDAESVVREIPPYRMPMPAKQMPARSRMVEWLVAATVAVLLVGGGSMLKDRQPDQNAARVPSVDTGTITPNDVTPPTVAATEPAPAHTHALTLAADTQELSDGNLQQLMDEIETFDALPNSEPEPVFTVDTSEGR
jgi:anti-sigma factor RsiW